MSQQRASTSPNSATELQKASEAVQQAASAVIAAIESSRARLRQQQAMLSLPTSYRSQEASKNNSTSNPFFFHQPEDKHGYAVRSNVAMPIRESPNTLQEVSITPVMASRPFLFDKLPGPTPKSPRPQLGSSPSSQATYYATRSFGSTMAGQNCEATFASAPILSTIDHPQRTHHAQQSSQSSSAQGNPIEVVEGFKAIRHSATYDQFNPVGISLDAISKEPYSNKTNHQSRTDNVNQPQTSRRQIPRKPIPAESRVPPRGHHPSPLGMSLGHEIVFVAVICMTQALMLAGLAQALVPSRIISRTFHTTTPSDLAWYSAAYGLTAGTFVLPAGRLGDLLGHKRVLTAGFVWSALWSFMAGLAYLVESGGANGAMYFCCCRAMQGIGSAIQVPNGQAMLGWAYTPGPRKALALCFFGAAAPLGFVVGAVFASLLALNLAWKWSFFVLAAAHLAMAALGVFILPNTEQKPDLHTTAGAGLYKNNTCDEGAAVDSAWARFDGLGTIVGVTGLILVSFAWNQAPSVSWTTPYIYFILVLGVMTILAFGYIEAHARYPLLPVSAMRSTANVLACVGTGWGCFAVWLYYDFEFLEILRGWSPLLAAGAHAHAPLSGLIASLLVFLFMGKLCWRPQWVLFISMCAFTLGSLLMATAPVQQTYWLNTFFSILVMPFGMEMSNPAAAILLSNSVSQNHQGIAASLVVTVVNYSISIALGIAGTIETQVRKNEGDILGGYRAAQHFGVGLGCLGTLLAAIFVVSSYIRLRKPGEV